MQLIDLTGYKSGRLTVVERVGSSPSGQATWLCQCDCGNTSVVRGSDLRERRIKSCGCLNKEVASREHSGERNNSWNGGRIKTNGYIYILQKDHPNAKRNGYVLEHRLVVENMLGRYLTDKEEVHHINRNKQDNNPFNLWVFPSRSEHIKHERLIRRTGRITHPALQYARGLK